MRKLFLICMIAEIVLLVITAIIMFQVLSLDQYALVNFNYLIDGREPIPYELYLV